MLRMSQLNTLAACPGSLAACSDCEESESSEWALYGTHGHECMAASTTARKLTIIPHKDFDLWGDVDRFWSILKSLVNEHGGWDKATLVQVEKPVVLTLTNATNQRDKHVVTGTSDLVVYFKHLKLMMVFDYKFGKGYVPRADLNLQIGGYGLAAYQEMLSLGEFDVDAVEVHMITLGMGHSSHLYKPYDLEELEEFLFRVVHEAHGEDAPRTIGVHCKYCTAMLTSRCPETCKTPGLANKYGRNPMLITTSVAHKILAAEDSITKAIETSKALIRYNLENGKNDPVFKLGTQANLRKVKDKTGFLRELERHGVDVPWEHKLVWEQVTDAIRKQKGVSEKKANEMINEIFGDYITTVKGRAPLIRA